MQIFEITAAPPQAEQPSVLAIGKFDGVHIGHQAILSQAKALQDPGTTLAVMSFWPHPAWTLAQKPGYDRMLTPYSEQVRQLQALGVQALYRVRFTPEYAATTAEAFVRDHLTKLNLRHVVVGFDFSFGKGGAADAGRLQSLCAEVGTPVTIVRPVEENGAKVSSSQIREHLAHGRVESAEALLGRPYTVEGMVVSGAKLGRQIGFPTANLGDLDEYVLPGAGVYAVSVELVGEDGQGGNHWFGVLNAGYRPTVDGREFKLEVFLLGFEGDLYGQRLRVSFLRRVRDEVKFAGIDELKAQIAKDVAFTKETLGLA